MRASILITAAILSMVVIILGGMVLKRQLVSVIEITNTSGTVQLLTETWPIEGDYNCDGYIDETDVWPLTNKPPCSSLRIYDIEGAKIIAIDKQRNIYTVENVTPNMVILTKGSGKGTLVKNIDGTVTLNSIQVFDNIH